MSKSQETTQTKVESKEETKVSRIVKDGFTLEQIERDYPKVSDRIRFLDSKGYTRSEIANFLGKLYQHVRNVLVQDLNKKNAGK